VQYAFDSPKKINELRLIFDSDLNRRPLNMPCNYPLNAEPVCVPETMIKAFRIEALNRDGSWNVIAEKSNNYQRLFCVKVDVDTTAVRFVPIETWGDENANLFAWDVK